MYDSGNTAVLNASDLFAAQRHIASGFPGEETFGASPDNVRVTWDELLGKAGL